jgi:hypothetical protein
MLDLETALMGFPSKPERRDAIRELNDDFRRTFVGGTVLITPGVAALSAAERAELLAAVREYDLFEYENDPHGEHDFGIVDLGAGRFLWKVDYYDRGLTWASPDPADPAVTSRVLTIMRAEEY